MAFANWKTKKQQSAIAIVAISAIDRQQNSFDTEKNTPSIATIASIAIAGSENPKKSEPTTQTKPLPQSPFLGGSDSVIIANSTNAQAANDPPPKGEVKPVIQKPVQQVVAQIEPLKKDSSTTDLSHQLAGQVKQGGGVQPPMEDGHLNHKTKVQPTPQIEESSRPEVLGEVKPEPQKNGAAPKFYGDDIFPKNGDNRVGRNNSFNQRKEPLVHQQGECEPVQAQPHTATELNTLLTRYEKALFHHLLACPYCHIEKAQYCVSGYAMGSVYDALLLNRDDAQARRESLALRVDRACISGRRAFTAFNPTNAPPPPNTAFQTRKYGNTHEYETFINHWTACEVCKPNLDRYCSEGQRLKEVARA